MKHLLDFLSKLKKNNNREWFEANKEQFLKSKEDLEIFTDKLIHHINKFDKKIDPNLKGKDCLFRIYKDVRFSKDKTPYKTNMGANISPGGRKSSIPGYYLHIEPGNCFLAGGYYMPDAENLNAIRQEIDYNKSEFLKIMNNKAFKSYFNGLDEIDVLKTVPKGYSKDHELIEVLKHKHFIVSYSFDDKLISDPNSIKEITTVLKAMFPFVEFLRKATEK